MMYSINKRHVFFLRFILAAAAYYVGWSSPAATNEHNKEQYYVEYLVLPLCQYVILVWTINTHRPAEVVKFYMGIKEYIILL